MNGKKRGVDMEDLYFSLHTADKNSQLKISGIAAATGLRVQTLINKLNPQDVSHQPTLSDFVMVIKQADDTTPVDVLCEMFGGRFVSRTDECASSVFSAALHAISEGGDVAKVVEQAMADGKITQQEREQINREITEAVNGMNVLRNTINKGVDSNG